MTNIPAITGHRLMKALKKLGFEVVRSKGSHHFLQHADGRCTTVPVHPGETIGGNTKQLDIAGVLNKPGIYLSDMWCHPLI
jgi:predicted RNA binding protein YcfA (HicA-like mRNA interferase family)